MTVRIESWGGEIAEIGAIYPFSAETIMVIIGLILWIAWFVVQGRMENREYQDELSDQVDGEEPRGLAERESKE